MGYYPPAYREYAIDESPEPKTLLILPINNLRLENTAATFSAHYRGALKKTLSPDSEKIIMHRLICRSLRKYAENAIVKCDENFHLNPEDMRDTLLAEPFDVRWSPRDSDAVDTFFVPGKLRLDPKEAPNYILLISNLKFTTRTSAQKTEMLEMTGSYVLLEYPANSILAYGHLNSYGSYTTKTMASDVGELTPDTRRYDMTRNAWTYVLDWASVQIIRYTPFQGNAVRKYLNNWKGFW